MSPAPESRSSGSPASERPRARQYPVAGASAGAPPPAPARSPPHVMARSWRKRPPPCTAPWSG